MIMTSEQLDALEIAQKAELIESSMYLDHFAKSDDSYLRYSAISKIYEILDELLSANSFNSAARAEAADGLNDLLIAYADSPYVSGYLTALEK